VEIDPDLDDADLARIAGLVLRIALDAPGRAIVRAREYRPARRWRKAVGKLPDPARVFIFPPSRSRGGHCYHYMARCDCLEDRRAPLCWPGEPAGDDEVVRAGRREFYDEWVGAVPESAEVVVVGRDLLGLPPDVNHFAPFLIDMCDPDDDAKVFEFTSVLQFVIAKSGQMVDGPRCSQAQLGSLKVRETRISVGWCPAAQTRTYWCR